MSTLMSLGLFVFSLETAAYDELSRRTGWRHAQTSRIRARSASQFLGPGDDTITLPGLLAPPVTGAFASLDQLREMGDQGQAFPLISGAGKVYGDFVIENLDERHRLFFPDGTPRRIEFTLDLRLVADPAGLEAGSADAGDVSA